MAMLRESISEMYNASKVKIIIKVQWTSEEYFRPTNGRQ